MEKNKRLEELSDKVRKGEPIDFAEAIEVIEYQETLRAKREKSILIRFLQWLRLAR